MRHITGGKQMRHQYTLCSQFSKELVARNIRIYKINVFFGLHQPVSIILHVVFVVVLCAVQLPRERAELIRLRSGRLRLRVRGRSSHRQHVNQLVGACDVTTH